ncbi:MAG TPA: phage terminase large subunit [Terriglobales bacterium]|nr:phage terminase large subunit [Terriglobales bacterium]
MELKINPDKLDKLTPEEKREVDQLLFAEETRQMELDLYKFFKVAWKILEPKTDLQDSWHYRYICEWLMLVANGQFKERYPEADGLIINVPPRSLKSTIISIIFPVWCWINDPSKRFIVASYALSLSTDFSVKRRALITSKWFQQRWGRKFQLREDQNEKAKFFNDATGQMVAAGVKGTLTGVGGNILVLDDPLNPEQAASDSDRATANRWTDDTFLTRKDDPSKDVAVLVMQRLHEDDVTGMLLAKKNKWVHLCIPLEAEQDTDIVFPISNKAFVRPKGNVLTPKRNTPIVVEGLKLSPRKFAGQFQQRPAPKEGNIIKRSWIRYWGDPNDANSPSLPSDFKRGLLSFDCTFKGKSDNDYVSGLAVGVRGADRFLIDRTYRQMSFTQTLQAITEMRKKHPWCKEILVEDKANGPAIIDTLRSKVPGLIAVNPKGDKKERLEIASYTVESGNWYFPHPSICPWVEEFIENLVTFPNAKHDDDCDAFSQVEMRLGKGGGGAAFLAYYDKLLMGEQPDPDPTDDMPLAIPEGKTHFTVEEAKRYGLVK